MKAKTGQQKKCQKLDKAKTKSISGVFININKNIQSGNRQECLFPALWRKRRNNHMAEI